MYRIVTLECLQSRWRQKNGDIKRRTEKRRQKRERDAGHFDVSDLRRHGTASAFTNTRLHLEHAALVDAPRSGGSERSARPIVVIGAHGKREREKERPAVFLHPVFRISARNFSRHFTHMHTYIYGDTNEARKARMRPISRPIQFYSILLPWPMV